MEISYKEKILQGLKPKLTFSTGLWRCSIDDVNYYSLSSEYASYGCMYAYLEKGTVLDRHTYTYSTGLGLCTTKGGVRTLEERQEYEEFLMEYTPFKIIKAALEHLDYLSRGKYGNH